MSQFLKTVTVVDAWDIPPEGGHPAGWWHHVAEGGCFDADKRYDKGDLGDVHLKPRAPGAQLLPAITMPDGKSYRYLMRMGGAECDHHGHTKGPSSSLH